MHAQRAIINEVEKALKRNGYEMMQFERSCFDICAKNKTRTILLKVLANIDSFSVQQAQDLSKMANAIDASACIIGIHGRNFLLKDHFVYERFNIPVLSPKTFEKSLEDFMPVVFSKKGKPVVKIKNDKLHNLRQECNLSYRDLGEKVNASKKTMYVIEKTGFASEDIASRIEKFFDEALTDVFDLFSWDIPAKRSEGLEGAEKQFVLSTENIGLESFILRNAPVNTITITKNKTILGDWDDNLSKQRAQTMKNLAEFCSTYNVVLTERDENKDTFEEIPVVSLVDLETIKTGRQFIKLIVRRS